MRAAVQSPPFAGILDLGRDGLLRVVMAPHDRTAISRAIDNLLGLLDAMDGDPDREADYYLPLVGTVTSDDEPSLGWTYRYDGLPAGVFGDGGDDRELEPEHDEDSGDAELNGDEFEDDARDAPG